MIDDLLGLFGGVVAPDDVLTRASYRRQQGRKTLGLALNASGRAEP